MPIPPFRSFGTSETIKQLAQWANQPMLTHALREAAQKLGIREVPSLSSLQELLRQAGRWVDVATEPWQSRADRLLVPGINATGECFSGRWAAPRFSPQSLALLSVLHGSTTEDADAESHCRSALTGATGAADALVAPNLGIAIHLAVQGLMAENRIERVVLPRPSCVRIPSGPTPGGSMLPEMLEACGVPVREIGSNRECLVSDYQRGLDQPKPLLMVATCISRDTALPEARSLAAASHGVVCELAFDASLHDLSDLGIETHALIRRWDQGPDLIIVPGHHLLGGPECGVLLGKREWIQTIRKLAQGAGLLADRATHLLLKHAISESETRDAWNTTPVGAVMSNSIANLENRAKRIALQCDIPESKVHVDWSTRPCKLGSGVWHDIALDSAVLRVTPKTGTTPARIAEQWSAQSPAVWGNVLSDRIELVLRTVDPGEDAALVAAIRGLSCEPQPAPLDSAPTST